jgi:hypothetical protein
LAESHGKATCDCGIGQKTSTIVGRLHRFDPCVSTVFLPIGSARSTYDCINYLV